MASYRQMLLDQTEPLEGHEVRCLQEWLEVLREDVEAFGATPEDEARMEAIARRIESWNGAQPSGPG